MNVALDLALTQEQRLNGCLRVMKMLLQVAAATGTLLNLPRVLSKEVQNCILIFDRVPMNL
jgi:hypothetical protein